MAKNYINKFQEQLKEALDFAYKALRNTDISKPIGTLKETLDELLKSTDRDEILKELKTLKDKKHMATDWVPPASAMDFLAASERDLRVRYRSRIDNYRMSALQKKFILDSMEHYVSRIEKVK